jgi:pyruvate,water dikinase
MASIIDSIKSLVFKNPRADSSSVEELRRTFRSRYHQFKLLLNANNKALEIMAEMTEALQGRWPFGMSFVRSRCTRVSTNVFQIVKHLDELNPGRYDALYDRFKEIQKQINPSVYPRTSFREGPMAMHLKAVNRNTVDQVGSKMANLGEIGNQIHIKVPNGFVITAPAYRRFMQYNDLQSEIDRRIQSANVERLDELYGLSAAIQQLIIGATLPEVLKEAILLHYHRLEQETGKGTTLAMRSSALGEDIFGASFAGQYRSELNVSGENISQAYKEIVASKYSPQAMTYRLNRGIRDEDVAMCVGCLRMVDAVSGGVVYSRNPLNASDDAVIIYSVWGLPKPVVDGSTPVDLFVVSRGDPLALRRKDIPRKNQKFVCYPDEGVCRMDLSGEKSEQPSLSDEKAKEIARIAIQLEKHYRHPQDIEWGIEPDGTVVVFQCRPLKQAAMERIQQASATTSEENSDSIFFEAGVTASSGVAAGPVYVVRKDMDTLQFPEGAVLVTAQALPRWATLLNRAAAVVTEQGTVAGHLANVSREFGVPALFGVKKATERMENGQWVTVDADTGRIYKGRMDALLEKRERPRNLMEGSPVFEALKNAAEWIIPLNLLDPTAPQFSPQNCRTFHDITRFCHEKAVQEMFDFGKSHHFPERSSKQLHVEVPMQWWVLNLDDGFREEVEGKYVRLENIVSIPMLALWEGITAVPWEGPPPVDGKGFMSVMFQATANRALVPGMRSQYANRNYFMISKNYCSLTSRLGFHFSTVETLISDRASENYISFQFKGGAADDHRRHRRVLFVGEILEDYGFRVDAKEDHLIARVEGYEKDLMEAHLRVLGYLTMHTRQLDMIMSNSASVEYYRSKIKKDLEALFRSW